MITKSTEYLRNFNLYCDSNYGKNGLLSFEGLFILILTALMINDLTYFYDEFIQLIQLDKKKLSQVAVTNAVICVGAMFFIYIINLFATNNKERAINNFSWSIIIIAIASIVIFLFNLTAGPLKEFAQYDTDIALLSVSLFLILVISLCAKSVYFPEASYITFFRNNYRYMIAFFLSSCVHMIVFLR